MSSVDPVPGPELFGVIAAFAGPEELLEAARRSRAAGYGRIDTFSPFPIHGMSKALGLRRSMLPGIVLAAGMSGAGLALMGMLYINTVEYPIVVGGKPHGALEPLVPITFEVGVLFAAIATVIGMLLLNALPQLYHPVFRHGKFARATDDHFFITIEASDPRFDPDETVHFLRGLGGECVTLVEA